MWYSILFKYEAVEQKSFSRDLSEGLSPHLLAIIIYFESYSIAHLSQAFPNFETEKTSFVKTVTKVNCHDDRVVLHWINGQNGADIGSNTKLTIFNKWSMT